MSSSKCHTNKSTTRFYAGIGKIEWKTKRHTSKNTQTSRRRHTRWNGHKRQTQDHTSCRRRKNRKTRPSGQTTKTILKVKQKRDENNSPFITVPSLLYPCRGRHTSMHIHDPQRLLPSYRWTSVKSRTQMWGLFPSIIIGDALRCVNAKSYDRREHLREYMQATWWNNMNYGPIHCVSASSHKQGWNGWNTSMNYKTHS